MKKSLALIIVSLMLVTTVFSADYSSDSSQFPYLQTFESSSWVPTPFEVGQSTSLLSKNPDNWNCANYVSNNYWMYLTRVEDSTKNYSFELRASANATSAKKLQAQIGFANASNPGYSSDYLVVDMDIMATNTVLEKAVYIRNQSASWDKPLILTTSGTFKIGGADTGVKYIPNKWYNVKFLINKAEDKAVAYIDGKRTGNTITMSNWSGIGYIYYEVNGQINKSADSFFFDNVKVESAAYSSDFAPDSAMSTPSEGATGIDTNNARLKLAFKEELLSAPAVTDFTVNGTSGLVKSSYVFASQSKYCYVNLNSLQPNTTYTVSYNNVKDIYGRVLSGSISFTTGDPTEVYSSTADILPMKQTFDGDAWLALTNGFLDIGSSYSIGANNPENWKTQNYDAGNSNQLWPSIARIDDVHNNVFELRATESSVKKNLQAYLAFPDIETYKSNYIEFDSKVMTKDNKLAKDIQIRGNDVNNTIGPIISAVSFATDNTIKVAGQNTDLTYENNVWYDVKILINKNSGTYVASINGVTPNAVGYLGNWNELSFIYFLIASTTTPQTDSFYFDDVVLKVVDVPSDNTLLPLECIPTNEAQNVDVDSKITLKFSKPLIVAPTAKQFAINNNCGWVRSIEFDSANPTVITLMPYGLNANALNTVNYEVIDFNGQKTNGLLQFTTGNAKSEFTFGKAMFYSADAEISAITGGDITARLSVTNNFSGKTDIKLIAALYNGNTMTDIKITDGSVLAGTTAELSTVVTVPSENTSNYSIKLFAWDGVSAIVPLRFSATLGNQLID